MFSEEATPRTPDFQSRWVADNRFKLAATGKDPTMRSSTWPAQYAFVNELERSHDELHAALILAGKKFGG